MSTIARSLNWQSLYPPKRKHFWWGVLALLAFAILLVDLPLLNPNHPYRSYHFKVRWALIPHLLCGSVALISGAIQFSSRIRARNPAFHRMLGRYYVGAVMIAAPMGILITILGPKDPFYTVGVATHAAVWFITTLMAFLTARNRQIPEHRQWMIRSYILTFSFIATRVIGPLWGLMGVDSPHKYGIIDTGLNVAYLLVADIAINWRQITTRRAS